MRSSHPQSMQPDGPGSKGQPHTATQTCVSFTLPGRTSTGQVRAAQLKRARSTTTSGTAFSCATSCHRALICSCVVSGSPTARMAYSTSSRVASRALCATSPAVAPEKGMGRRLNHSINAPPTPMQTKSNHETSLKWRRRFMVIVPKQNCQNTSASQRVLRGAGVFKTSRPFPTGASWRLFQPCRARGCCRRRHGSWRAFARPSHGLGANRERC